MDQRLGKVYKLCSPKLIDDVFANGEQLRSYPFVVRYKICPLNTDTRFQIVFSAPKRTFRKAVERNRIKRLCKEAFRKEKNQLESFLINQNKQLALFLVYTSHDEVALNVLEGRTRKLFDKLITELKKNDTTP